MMKTCHIPKPRWPVHPETSDRWLSVAASPDGKPWLAVRREVGGISRLTAYEATQPGDAMQRLAALPTDGAPDRAALAVHDDGTPFVAWNGVSEDGWHLMLGRPTGAAAFPVPEVIRDRAALCLPPALAIGRSVLWVAWPEQVDGGMQLQLARRGDAERQWAIHTVSKAGVDTARPTLAAGADRLLVAWDQYRAGFYEIVWQLRDQKGVLCTESVLRREGRHCLTPAVTVDYAGHFFLVYQERTDVVDRRYGIQDHRISAHAVWINPDGSVRVIDGGQGEGACIADLGPGLLATEEDAYRSYDGWRRRPQVTVTSDNRAWLCAESRIPGGDEREGVLRGFCLQDGTEVRHTGGVSYAVPPRAMGAQVWAAYIPADVRDKADYRTSVLDHLRQDSRLDIGTERQWEASQAVPREIPADIASGPMAGYHLYWFDLHAHSSRSPDAEGDPDELLHYGRDVAALDGMAVMDNDYYPHKALAEAEWRMENELARLYNEDGRFLVFPAYEFTYFDEALMPSINHRTVIYRRPGGSMHRCIDPGSSNLSDLVTRLPREDVLLLAHHGTWQAAGDDVDGVEVCSSWRVCIEEMDFVEQRLLAGDRFAFLASSDSHRACPGLGGALTGVFARELTRDAIFKAIKARRTIATQGQRIDVRLTVGDLQMGEAGALSGVLPVRLRVRSPRDLEAVEIVRDEKVIRRIERPGTDVDEALEDSPDVGTHHYRVRIRTEGYPGFNIEPGDRKDYRPFEFTGPYGSNLAAADGPFAWTTPVWVEVKE